MTATHDITSQPTSKASYDDCVGLDDLSIFTRIVPFLNPKSLDEWSVVSRSDQSHIKESLKCPVGTSGASLKKVVTLLNGNKVGYVIPGDREQLYTERRTLMKLALQEDKSISEAAKNALAVIKTGDHFIRKWSDPKAVVEDTFKDQQADIDMLDTEEIQHHYLEVIEKKISSLEKIEIELIFQCVTELVESGVFMLSTLQTLFKPSIFFIYFSHHSSSDAFHEMVDASLLFFKEQVDEFSADQLVALLITFRDDGNFRIDQNRLSAFLSKLAEKLSDDGDDLNLLMRIDYFIKDINNVTLIASVRQCLEKYSNTDVASFEAISQRMLIAWAVKTTEQPLPNIKEKLPDQYNAFFEAALLDRINQDGFNFSELHQLKDSSNQTIAKLSSNKINNHTLLTNTPILELYRMVIKSVDPQKINAGVPLEELKSEVMQSMQQDPQFDGAKREMLCRLGVEQPSLDLKRIIYYLVQPNPNFAVDSELVERAQKLIVMPDFYQAFQLKELLKKITPIISYRQEVTPEIHRIVAEITQRVNDTLVENPGMITIAPPMIGRWTGIKTNRNLSELNSYIFPNLTNFNPEDDDPDISLDGTVLECIVGEVEYFSNSNTDFLKPLYEAAKKALLQTIPNRDSPSLMLALSTRYLPTAIRKAIIAEFSQRLSNGAYQSESVIAILNDIGTRELLEKIKAVVDEDGDSDTKDEYSMTSYTMATRFGLEAMLAGGMPKLDYGNQESIGRIIAAAKTFLRQSIENNMVVAIEILTKFINQQDLKNNLHDLEIELRIKDFSSKCLVGFHDYQDLKKLAIDQLRSSPNHLQTVELEDLVRLLSYTEVSSLAVEEISQRQDELPRLNVELVNSMLNQINTEHREAFRSCIIKNPEPLAEKIIESAKKTTHSMHDETEKAPLECCLELLEDSQLRAVVIRTISSDASLQFKLTSENREWLDRKNRECYSR